MGTCVCSQKQNIKEENQPEGTFVGGVWATSKSPKCSHSDSFVRMVMSPQKKKKQSKIPEYRTITYTLRQTAKHMPVRGGTEV